MRLKAAMAGITIGSLVLGGVIVANPFSGFAQDQSTPAAENADDAPAGTPVIGDPLLSPAVDLSTAQEAALAGQDGANVIAVELNGDDGTLDYSITLDNGFEVSVDATTGEVTESEEVGSGDGDGENADNGDENDTDHNEDDNGGQHDDGGDDEEEGN